ncbi:MAG: di-trans,poly-cis-decaprenylcistransferase [Proteobacteria bacterium]|nr:di-trans,poly-cis-decaprenylcistransferase [Pseudomonadota bacterium]MBT6192617.1 di-trans,poly-cis-decaprenylcistransferase [Pseudomonadota bacterium]MBT6465682.1 di-trans,poly-cis-decaprenylcistransferase [Pseudomonadota bacterium]MBT7247448.1 di-trans,poly-cis-decaprenylcistransferase [Pseudomonadota bacterium]MBT7562713.1 di-trans,poly-cis-decaprenylcistransferase [Pseudomonadota bacterium]
MMTILDTPKHIAIVMDGNGRWAEKRGLNRVNGHKEGVHATRRVVEACIKNGIETLSLFAFSSENWRRPPSEVQFLMTLLVTSINSERASLFENGVRVSVIGDREPFSLDLKKAIRNIENTTLECDRMHLVIAVNYGGKWEISRAAKLIAEQVVDGSLLPEEINEGLFDEFMKLPGDSLPDLFIRAGGEHRLSNYYLWQMAYTELYFVDCLWPDFHENHLTDAIISYSNRQRRFGGLLGDDGDPD